jgi:hypothetical protein
LDNKAIETLLESNFFKVEGIDQGEMVTDLRGSDQGSCDPHFC